jgi:arginyl-tRNA--protein-N-Asp/Glu arginylyltransferase
MFGRTNNILNRPAKHGTCALEQALKILLNGLQPSANSRKITEKCSVNLLRSGASFYLNELFAEQFQNWILIPTNFVID